MTISCMISSKPVATSRSVASVVPGGPILTGVSMGKCMDIDVCIGVNGTSAFVGTIAGNWTLGNMELGWVVIGVDSSEIVGGGILRHGFFFAFGFSEMVDPLRLPPLDCFSAA
jgi:hypothetical protein